MTALCSGTWFLHTQGPWITWTMLTFYSPWPQLKTCGFCWFSQKPDSRKFCLKLIPLPGFILKSSLTGPFICWVIISFDRGCLHLFYSSSKLLVYSTTISCFLPYLYVNFGVGEPLHYFLEDLLVLQ